MVALRTEEERGQEEDGAAPRVPQHAKRTRLRIVDEPPVVSIYRPGGYANAPLPLVRRDSLPEDAHYADTGCELAASCLACPLPRCQYDAPGSVRRWLLAARDREIAVVRSRHGAPIDAIAATYGLTRRHVFRILAEQRARRARLRQPRVKDGRPDATGPLERRPGLHAEEIPCRSQ